MTLSGIRFGEVSVTRLGESLGPALVASQMFPRWDASVVERHREWLVPGCYDEASARIITSVHSWIVRTPQHVILIDTCGGNGKNRAGFPKFHMQNHPYLDRLQAAGFAAEEVDFVLCTHLHVDHCGWNTRLEDGRWVPTFPNARYIFSQAELAEVMGCGPQGPAAGVYEDSVLPVIASGQAEVVELSERDLGDYLRIRPTPGHSPGHMAVQLVGCGRGALFCGDVMHSPLQVYHPDWNTAFCADAVAAIRSRKWVLEHCAESGIELMPAHFPASHRGRVRRKGESYSWRFA